MLLFVFCKYECAQFQEVNPSAYLGCNLHQARFPAASGPPVIPTLGHPNEDGSPMRFLSVFPSRPIFHGTLKAPVDVSVISNSKLSQMQRFSHPVLAVPVLPHNNVPAQSSESPRNGPQGYY
eukprot:TRINITY_DN777_c0_g1_i2.p1 TRINITY_DN777_c0_g1~~TRINITY_DN777_c0_g1_i2.p1  ORF type:complete len:122 (-),score=7.80 TRINITY_DN777_c0_g1_i2:296-661(-)